MFADIQRPIIDRVWAGETEGNYCEEQGHDDAVRYGNDLVDDWDVQKCTTPRGVSLASCTTTTTSTVLWRLYRTVCVSQQPQLRTRGFSGRKVLLPACPCWWQLVHSDYGEGTRVLNTVTCTISVPCHCLRTVFSILYIVLLEFCCLLMIFELTSVTITWLLPVYIN